MAHRALVAYERPDGRYDVHTARWGGHEWLVPRITPTDPYADGAVDPEPRVVGRPLASVRTMLDFARHEALYVVDRAYAVESYVPLWLDLDHYLGPAADDSVGDGSDTETDDPEGLLVAVDSATEAARLRRWLRAAKATLAEAVAADCLTPEAARSVLERAAARQAGERARLDADVD